MDKVLCCDDLVVEILFRLPVRPLLRFKTVSKHWYFLISSPSFKLRIQRHKPDPPCGIFIPAVPEPNLPLQCAFVSFDFKNLIKPRYVTPQFAAPDVQDFRIEHSCNGLMLFSGRSRKFSIQNHDFVVTNKSYIYNPTTNQFSTLPVPDIYKNSDDRYGMNLAFDPSRSPHYKVLYISPGIETYDKVLDIYSSETRTFKPSYKFTPEKRSHWDFRGGVYWNNVIHWVHNRGLVACFNLDQEVIIHQLRPPPTCVFPKDYYIFESRGCILLGEVHTRKLKVKIYELKRDYSRWFVKYHVDLMQLLLSFPKIVMEYEFCLLSVVLGEKDEDDSFLVVDIPGKVVRFNLVSKTFYKLCDFTSYPLVHAVQRRELCLWPCVFQFMESLYSF